MDFDEKLEILAGEDEIKEIINKIADEINRDFKDKKPVLLGILKSSFVFMADLIRLLNFPMEIEFIELNSYENENSSGEIHIKKDLKIDIDDRDILIIEDIVDTGLTLNYLINYLKTKGNPRSVKICALASKPARRLVSVKVDYLGFEVPDVFIVGYGLDYNGYYRNLPYIAYLKKD